jgi:8-oxo-dGTP diphosphatase
VSDTDRPTSPEDPETEVGGSPSLDPVPAGAVHVTAAVVLHGARVLVARRVRPPELTGLWEFPGGKVEAGESPEAALTRELVEELGCEVRVLAFMARSAEHARARPLVLDAYHCALVSGEPRPDPLDGTHDRVRWVDAAELAALSADRLLAPLDVPLAALVVAALAAPDPGILAPPRRSADE